MHVVKSLYAFILRQVLRNPEQWTPAFNEGHVTTHEL